MRILVTGGTGFVGRGAASALASEGHEVFVSSRRDVAIDGCKTVVADMLISAEVCELLRLVRPEVILHLAWYVEPGKFWTSPENLDWTTATLQLLHAAKRAGVRRIVCAGTCMEYDLSAEAPCNEFSTPTKPATLYAVAKDLTRQAMEEYANSQQMEFAWGRLFFLFGPNEHANRLVSSICLSLLKGEPALLSSGGQIRDFMDVRDAGAAFGALATSKVAGVVNIASGQGVRIADLAENIRAALGGAGELRLGALPDRPNEPKYIVADVARLRSEAGFHPQSGLHERLAETLDWWRSQLSL